MKDASRYTRGHLSRDAVRALYGGAVTLSASRMDMARSCHFAYFMRYGLKARERTGAGFDAPQIGTFVHDVMEHTLRQAKECGGLHTLSKDKLHALVPRVDRGIHRPRAAGLERKKRALPLSVQPPVCDGRAHHGRDERGAAKLRL